MNTLTLGRRTSIRYLINVVTVVLAALWLSGCGSGGGDSSVDPARPVTPVDPVKPEEPVQVCNAADWENVACPEGMICVADILGMSVANITPVTRGNRPDWSADNQRIVFQRLVSSVESDIFVINADGSNESRLARGTQPAWSPDSNRIAFVSADGINIMQGDGSGIMTLIRHDFTDDVRNIVGAPSWSPDGQSIVFEHFSDYATVSADIYVKTEYEDASDIRRLAVTGMTSRRGGTDPAWSPNGGTIAFVDNARLMSVDAAGGAAVSITGVAARARPDWFPDASIISFTGRPTTQYGPVNIRILDSWKPPVILLAGAQEASWSPDGGRIVFASAAPDFPPAENAASVFYRSNLSSDCRRERFVLYEDGKFELQILSIYSGFHLYTGLYSHLSGPDRISFRFTGGSADHQWKATGYLDGPNLSVAYNFSASMEGFENGLFVLSSTSP